MSVHLIESKEDIRFFVPENSGNQTCYPQRTDKHMQHSSLQALVAPPEAAVKKRTNSKRKDSPSSNLASLRAFSSRTITRLLSMAKRDTCSTKRQVIPTLAERATSKTHADQHSTSLSRRDIPCSRTSTLIKEYRTERSETYSEEKPRLRRRWTFIQCRKTISRSIQTDEPEDQWPFEAVFALDARKDIHHGSYSNKLDSHNLTEKQKEVMRSTFEAPTKYSTGNCPVLGINNHVDNPLYGLIKAKSSSVPSLKANSTLTSIQPYPKKWDSDNAVSDSSELTSKLRVKMIEPSCSIPNAKTNEPESFYKTLKTISHHQNSSAKSGYLYMKPLRHSIHIPSNISTHINIHSSSNQIPNYSDNSGYLDMKPLSLHNLEHFASPNYENIKPLSLSNEQLVNNHEQPEIKVSPSHNQEQKENSSYVDVKPFMIHDQNSPGAVCHHAKQSWTVNVQTQPETNGQFDNEKSFLKNSSIAEKSPEIEMSSVPFWAKDLQESFCSDMEPTPASQNNVCVNPEYVNVKPLLSNENLQN